MPTADASSHAICVEVLVFAPLETVHDKDIPPASASCLGRPLACLLFFDRRLEKIVSEQRHSLGNGNKDEKNWGRAGQLLGPGGRGMTLLFTYLRVLVGGGDELEQINQLFVFPQTNRQSVTRNATEGLPLTRLFYIQFVISAFAAGGMVCFRARIERTSGTGAISPIRLVPPVVIVLRTWSTGGTASLIRLPSI